MNVYFAGGLSNLRSTTLFHAMARLGYEGLIISFPEETYLSVGYFDNVPQIIDLERCKKLGIPLIRREVGGGPVLLDRGQVFYQLILKRGSEHLPFKVDDAYRKFSKPVIRTYKKLGVEVEYKPINDLVVKGSGRKISGQGAGDIGRCFVFVGNILMRFNTRLMAQVFKLPDESFREDMVRFLEDNLSWLERETDKSFHEEEVAEVLIEEFSKDLPLNEIKDIPPEAIKLADKLKEELTSEETTMEDTGKTHRLIKIREGFFVRNALLRRKDEKVRVSLVVAEGKVARVKIEGNGFNFLKRLEGVPYSYKDLKGTLEVIMPKGTNIQTEDILKALYG